jgi:hypothetical protein
MARVHANIRFEPGDVPRVDDDPSYDLFIVNAGSIGGAYLIVDDEAWDEAEAFARQMLDAIATRRARKAQQTEPVDAAV